jgi:hypothetical protein
MSELRDQTHLAALALVRTGTPLNALLTRGDLRRLAREVRDWYLDSYARDVTRGGTCVVATAGPPGAGKSSLLPTAIPDLATRLVIDADIAKDYLARWSADHGLYPELLGTLLPDGEKLGPLELSPLLHTTSTEAINLVRRDALAGHLDVVIEGTMASPAFGERLLLSLAKADYSELVIVSAETNRATAQRRAVERWWAGRQDGPALGGRLVLPETIDAAYAASDEASRCRANARALVATIRAGGTTIDSVTIAEYDVGQLARIDADPPQAVAP